MNEPSARLATLIVLVTGASLTYSACNEDLLGPLNNTVFVLETIDGEPLPATVVPEFGGLAWIVTADTIWLESGSKWRRHTFQRREEGVGGDPLDQEFGGKIVRQDGQIILSFDCKDADCVVPDRFIETSEGFAIAETFLHDGKALFFRRR